ncbi:MAG: GTPase [Comamonadaceae bacterium]|nr:MAG: GTPase [Comamonadaceae bacterium]
MTPQDSRSVVTLCLMAAFVDGQKHDREREEVRRIAENLATAGDIHLPTLMQDVLMKRQTLASVAASLQEEGARHLAYEIAVCVCDADGGQSEPERAFLRELREALKLSGGDVQAFDEAADAVAHAPITAPVPALTAAAAADAVVPAAPEIAPELASAAPATGPAVDNAALDKQILNAAILNGALELLPESLSTLAIIPLQMRLVYSIGKAHGYELDSGHVKDFLATVGVGLTSQYLEQAGRKLLGGLLGKVGGGLLRGVGKQAVSSGMSFASTYALGHVAKRYYGSGRQLSTQMLKDSFSGVVAQGQQLHTRYLPQMQEQARNLDTAKVMAMVRGR